MRRFIRRSTAVLAVAGSVLLAVTGLAVPASATIGYNVLFQNANSGKCLEVLDWRTDNFAPAGQFDCHGGANQQWNYNTDTGIIQNVNSGKCLEVLYYSTANLAAVGQYDCTGGLNQQWYMNRGNGLIANRNSDKCLEVLNWRLDNRAPVGQFDCHGGANQVWWYR